MACQDEWPPIGIISLALRQWVKKLDTASAPDKARILFPQSVYTPSLRLQVDHCLSERTRLQMPLHTCNV